MFKVVIVGAGGHAKVIADIVIKNGDNLIGFLDDKKNGKIFLEYEVLGKISDIPSFPSDVKFIVAIGDNYIRKEISEKYDVSWYTAIHPTATIALDATIGCGSCVMAKAVINSSAIIGKHCIINSASIIEHDNVIKDYVHVSPNATLCGTVTVGNLSFIGSSSVIRNNLQVADKVTIGIGGVVVKDITESGVYYGVPAKKYAD